MSKQHHPEWERAVAKQRDAAPTANQPSFEPVPADEVGSLARQLGRAYDELVKSFQRAYRIEAAEAIEKARTPRDRALEMAATDPPEQVSWYTLAAAMEHDPAAALAAWQRVKEAAIQELRSGHRAAESLEWGNRPWDRARFFALRRAFREDLQPRGAVEATLVDLLTHHFALYLRWSERLTMYAETQGQSEDVKLKKEGYWMPPRMSEGAWMRWCAESCAGCRVSPLPPPARSISGTSKSTSPGTSLRIVEVFSKSFGNLRIDDSSLSSVRTKPAKTRRQGRRDRR